jgi:hypothetical protein
MSDTEEPAEPFAPVEKCILELSCGLPKGTTKCSEVALALFSELTGEDDPKNINSSLTFATGRHRKCS